MIYILMNMVNPSKKNSFSLFLPSSLLPCSSEAPPPTQLCRYGGMCLPPVVWAVPTEVAIWGGGGGGWGAEEASTTGGGEENGIDFIWAK